MLSYRVYLSVGAPLADRAVGGVVTHRAIVATDRRGALAGVAVRIAAAAASEGRPARPAVCTPGR